MPRIAGIYETAAAANQAIAALLSTGVAKDDISLILSSQARRNFEAATKDTGDRAVVDSAIGAGAGGVLGGLLAGLTAIGGVLIPGMQLLVVGPLVAVLSGIGGGAAIGGLAGALSAAGISAVEARRYEKEIGEGKAVILVDTRNDAQSAAVRAILSSEGADSIRAA